MPRNSVRRSLLVFALILGAFASPGFATTGVFFVEDLGSLWTRLVGAFHFASPLGKAGCEIDPNGKPVCLKNGCSVDPDGKPLCLKHGCTINPSGKPVCPKHGGGIDPDGKPLSEPAPSNAKLGCSVDPNGKPICTP